MSKISQEIARRLVNVLLHEKEKEVKSLSDKFSEMLELEYLKTIPKDVLQIADKYPNWIKKTSTLQLVGNGFGYEYEKTKNLVPGEREDGYILMFSPSEKVADKLKAAQVKYRKAKENIKKVRNELQGTLLALGTPKRIVEAFPELAIHVNQPVMSLSVDVAGVKKKINDLP